MPIGPVVSRPFQPNNPNNGPITGTVITASEALALTPVLWANRPAAAGNSGKIIRVSDIGVGGGLFISDGTYWRPLNGHLVLAAENLTAITTTQASGSTTPIPGWSLTIPAGLFDRPGTMLRGSIRAQLEGTVGSGAVLTASIRATFPGGLTTQRNLVRTHNLTSSNTQAHGLGYMTRIADNSIVFAQQSGVQVWSGNASGSSIDTTSGIAAGAFDLYLVGGIMPTPGEGELLRFVDVMVELIG